MALHLRPRSFSELMDATFEIIRARFAALATTAAIVMVPVMALSLVTLLANPNQAVLPGDPEVTVRAGTVVTSTANPALALLVIPIGLVAFVTYVIGFGAMMYIASRAYNGERVDVGPALSQARRRFWTLLRATIAKYIRAIGPVILLGIGGALVIPKLAGGDATGASGVVAPLLFLIPVAMVWGIVVLLRYAVTGPVVLNEDVSGSAALGRSAALTKGSKGRLFGIFLVLLIIMYAVMMTMLFTGMFVLRNLVLAQVLSNLVSLVTYPLAAVLITVIYFDLRIRTEGYDLEMMAGGLTDAASGGALPAAGATPRQTA
jgi:hypothetical protein